MNKPLASCGLLLGIVQVVSGPKSKTPRNPNYEYRNYSYPVADVAEAVEAARWEGVNITAYFRSALRLRLMETRAKRADHDRRMKGGK